jgi:hypothetical protein
VDDALRERYEGRARTGFVDLRSFDEGVVETFGAVVDPKSGDYHLKIDAVETVGFDPPKGSPFYRGHVEPRPGLPGIPITFYYPEDVFKKFSIPVIWVSRDSIDPAMQRWHPGMQQYRAPGRGALPVNYQRTQTAPVQHGADRVEQVDQATPFDFMYTINIAARNRAGAPRSQGANRILRHILGVYQPYCEVRLKDSIGDYRTYEAFMEGVGMLDEAAEINDRVIGFAVSLRIEGELDLNDPVIRKTVTQQVTTVRRR